MTRYRTKGWILGLVATALLSFATTASAQLMGLGKPLTIRFIGTFTPYGKDNPGGPDTLDVTINDKRFFFHVTAVQGYEGTDPNMMILSHLFPPMLDFMGPDKRLKGLESPVAGKSYAVEGWLYAADHTFYVVGYRQVK
ncbi:MAG: hypothetical protein FJ144_25770 [Deltaproteobacteria bacterium]|nr:hypothetical protein [Deltaproteobacteria bacterium]